MLLKYNIENLDLSIFKKHCSHYLSNMISLGINELKFCLFLDLFEITITATIEENDCWIRFFLKENENIILFQLDPRFRNLKFFLQLFSEGYGVCGILQVKDPQITTHQLCKVIDVIGRINKIKYFW
jgi:hypothetical protein